MNPASRRAFLGSMLGTAAAETACRLPSRPVPGEIRGADVATGHMLRANAPELGEPTRTIDVPIVIVGGGASGLAAAWRLTRLGGPRAVVLELEAEPGGTAQCGTDGVVPYPWGAHYVPSPRRENRALCALLSELGAFDGDDEEGNPRPRENWLVRDPEERLFENGEWHEGLFPKQCASAHDVRDFALFQRKIDALVGARDARGRRAFALPLAHCSDDPVFTDLDRMTMGAWLDREGITSPRVRWLVDYACRDDYGLRAHATSAWAGLFYFASRVAAPGRDAAPLLAWPEGNGRLIAHLVASTPGALRARTLVVDVASFEDRAEVLARDLTRGDVVRYRCERVIFAAPKFLATRLVRTLRDRPPRWGHDFEYGAWMVANLHLREHPRGPGAPIAWDNVIYDSPSLGYVVATHQAMRDDGRTILTYYYPYTDTDAAEGRRRLFAQGHRELSDAILSDLAPAHHHIDRLVERVDVWRWGHAMVRPRPGFVWGSSRREAAAVVGRVHMAHCDLSGVALFEEALHHGVRAAEEVVKAMTPTAVFETLT